MGYSFHYFLLLLPIEWVSGHWIYYLFLFWGDVVCQLLFVPSIHSKITFQGSCLKMWFWLSVLPCWEEMGNKLTPRRKWLRMKGQRDAVGVLVNPRCSRGGGSIAGPYNTDNSWNFLSLMYKMVAAFLCVELTQFDVRLFHRTTETKIVKLLDCTVLGTFLLNSPSFSLSLQPLPCKRIGEMFLDNEYLNVTSWFLVWVLAFILKGIWIMKNSSSVKFRSVTYGCEGEKWMSEIGSNCSTYLLKLYTR